MSGEHRPRADEEVTALLFEPQRTVNTGNAGPIVFVMLFARPA